MDHDLQEQVQMMQSAGHNTHSNNSSQSLNTMIQSGMVAGDAPGTLTFRAIGTGTCVGQALNTNKAAASVVVLQDDVPVILIGAGPGVLRECVQALGRVPPRIILPAPHLHYTADLQSLLQYEASYHRHTTVMAPDAVLTSAMNTIDDDITELISPLTTFSSMALDDEIQLTGTLHVIAEPCGAGVKRHNLMFVAGETGNSRVVAAWVDGPLARSRGMGRYRTHRITDAPHVISRCYKSKGYPRDSNQQVKQEFGEETGGAEKRKFYAIGYSADVRELTAPVRKVVVGNFLKIKV